MTRDIGSGGYQIRVTLLGTGTSVGIPLIGCTCRACTSPDPRDRRTRCSCLIEAKGLSILIDTSPDFRQQALENAIEHIDAVLFTHHHFDHIAGIDDLRPFLFSSRAPIHCYARGETVDSLLVKYDYIFGDTPHPSAPELLLHAVDGPFTVKSRRHRGSLEIVPVPVLHGELDILGFRLGPFGYVTDASELTSEAKTILSGVDTLVLNALRKRPHPTHFSVSQAIETARQIGARKTYFIHMTHDILHARDSAMLPCGFEFGYDGLSFSVPADRFAD